MDLSDKPELDLLPQALTPVSRAASKLAQDWVLIGAAARDLILLQAGSDPSPRRTKDVDIAVCVETWAQHEALRAELIHTHHATSDDSAPQRLLLACGTPIDIVPFGGISAEGAIQWPPDREWTLNVAGFEEALANCTLVILPGGLQVKTTSVHHILALKLMAWNDRHLSHPGRDAVDLALLMERATDFIELDELHDQHEHALQRHEWDPELASLDVLGQRLRDTLSPASTALVVDILRSQTLETGTLTLVRELRLDDRGLSCLRALLAGLTPA
jgi:predicted nucleotidyltransferase